MQFLKYKKKGLVFDGIAVALVFALTSEERCLLVPLHGCNVGNGWARAEVLVHKCD